MCTSVCRMSYILDRVKMEATR